MNLTRLLTFHEAAEALNFSQAAQKLNVTQPAVSTQIRELEQDLGVKLFNRIGKKIALTEAGEMLRRYSRRIFRLSNEAKAMMDDLRLVRRGTLNVGTTHTYAGHIMPPLLSRFQSVFPQVKVILSEGSSREIVKKVAALEIEVAVVAFPGQVKNVQFNLLRREELALVAAPDHPLAQKDKVPVKRLAEESFIMREKGSGTRLIARELFRRHRISPDVVFEVSSAEFIKEQVAAGMGLSFLTRSAVENDIQASRLAVIQLENESLKLSIHTATRVGHDLSRPAQAFLDIVSENQKNNRTASSKKTG